MNGYNKRSEGFNPLRVNSKYKSYLVPAIKIIISVALIAAAISWTSFWTPGDRRIEAAISMAGLLVSFLCAYIICVSVGEMSFVSENRERAKILEGDPAEYKTKTHPTVEILERFEESRDIELLAVINGKLVYLGVRTSVQCRGFPQSVQEFQLWDEFWFCIPTGRPQVFWRAPGFRRQNSSLLLKRR